MTPLRLRVVPVRMCACLLGYEIVAHLGDESIDGYIYPDRANANTALEGLKAPEGPQREFE